MPLHITAEPVETFTDFEKLAHERGFETVLERVWAPNTVLETHTHDFAVWAQVSRGEMWLTHSGVTRHLRQNDQFELDARVPHDERYGEEGAAYWVARRAA